MRRRFVTLDVFTDRRFTGNPLAVVFEPAGLDTETMQAIAREFGHPETVFVLPPENTAHRAKLRIFTPAAELRFAGHPTVGTAVALARLDGAAAREFVLEEGIGPVRCRITPLGADLGYASFMVPQLPVPAGATADAAAIAAGLGLGPGDIGFDSYKPARYSAGNAFTFVPLRSRAAIERAQPAVGFEAALGAGGKAMAYLFCRETAEQGHDFHVRMYAPAFGVREDPATGSGAAAFPGVLAAQGPHRDGDHSVRIEQGYEMGRPSLLEVTFVLRGGVLTSVSVGGHAVVATEGSIEA